MRNFFISFSFLFFLNNQDLEAQTLYAPQSIEKGTLQDFIFLLNKATGQSWQLKDSEKPGKRGIYLETATDKAFTTKESFRLQSNGRDQLVITSSSVEGLVFGFYKHLRNLGFKFYEPDELYSIYPKLQHPYGEKQNKTDQPFLQVRDFFGTGGFGSSQPDPEFKAKKAWDRWKLRNGFGASYQLGGHNGENFILDNYELLFTKPEWLAKPLTGNKHKDLLTKINYLNKDALEFYVNWSLKPLTQKGFELPPPNHTIYISMEPSDGGGFLNELPGNAGKSLPSISDQVYKAANRAAELLEKRFPNHPNIRVNLYAYSSHAAPPSFPLHPRVFVQLIPYQFQSIAFGPSFIKLWAAKVRHFALYDYFRYPDIQNDLPGGLTIGEVMKRLKHSVRNGSEGTFFETSYSKFSTGIPLWLIGRYMADGNAQWEKNLYQLTADLYGNAAPKMLSLFHLFYSEPNFTQELIGNAAVLIKDADALSTSESIRQRINELKLYLNYIDLVYQSRDLKKGKLYQRLLPLVEYAWKLFPDKIIHSYRIMQLVSYAFLNNDPSDREHLIYQQLHNDWFPDTERSKSAWNRIVQNISSKERENNFQELLKNYKPSTQMPSYYLKDMATIAKSQELKPKKQLIFGASSVTRGYVGIYTDKPAILSFKYQINGPQPQLRISSVDNDYLNDTAIVITKSFGTVDIRIPLGETTLFLNAGDDCSYRVELNLSAGMFYFDGSPRGTMAFYKNFTAPYEQYTYDASFYPSHIFIPGNISTINYRVQLNMLSITSPTGRKIDPELISKETGGVEFRKFSIQSNEGGKIWKTQVAGNFNYNFMNIPDRYLLLEKR
jgi:type IV secretory pathway component VirB8